MKILMLAGELSGDIHGAKLIQELTQEYNQLTVYAFGGDNMLAAGAKIITHINKLKVMGFVNIIFAIPKLIYQIIKLTKFITTNKIDLIILIDYPGFNLLFARIAKLLRYKILYYIAPKIWASRPNRIHTIKQYIDHVAIIFPFERQLYEAHDIPVTFVGNPCYPLPKPIAEITKLKLATTTNWPIINLMPGSRAQEIMAIGPIFLALIPTIKKLFPNTKFILAQANNTEKFYQQLKLPEDLIITNNSLAAMQVSTLTCLAAGTASLEATLLKQPMIVCYKTSKLNAWIAKRILTTKYIGLPNILAQRNIVPELLQTKLNLDNLATTIIDLLNHPSKITSIKADLNQVTKLLTNSPKTPFKIIISKITNTTTKQY